KPAGLEYRCVRCGIGMKMCGRCGRKSPSVLINAWTLVIVAAHRYILSMSSAETTAEPTVRVPAGWTSRFTLLWFGFWMAWLVPVQLVLPKQFAALDYAHKGRDFGITNGAAGVVALIALPVAGALCDRTRSRWGRRRVWMAAGVVVLALSLAALGPQRSWVGVMICWMFASL